MAPLKSACFCIDLAFGSAILGRIGICAAVVHILNMYTRTYARFSDDTENMQLIALSGCVIQIIVCLCLVGGARTNKKGLLVPWLVLNVIGCIIFNLAIFLQLDSISTNVWPGILIATLLADILWVYFWLIVVSLYMELQQNGKTTSIVYKDFHNTKLTASGNDLV